MSSGQFLSTPSERQLSNSRAAILAVLAILLSGLVLWLNFQRALRWAGIMNSKSIGYMIGGCFVAFVLGALGMFLVEKVRRKKTLAAVHVFGISAFAFFFTLIAMAPTAIKRASEPSPDAEKQMGTLMKEAAGKQPKGAEVNWWDGPSRDFFHDILERNQQYIAEVKSLDNSAIQDLYSAHSFTGKAHMEKVLTQLQALQAVEQEYASLDPIIKSMEARIAAAKASDAEKQQFLRGIRSSMDRALAPRTNLQRAEMRWLDTTVDLYEFTIAHSSAYSIRAGKLYFKDESAREEFNSRQSKAMALHQGFLRAKAAFEESRKNNLNQMGVSPSDLTPSQLGKLK